MRNLIVPDSFSVRMQKHVRVSFDQTRHERHTMEIDNLCIGRRVDLIERAHSLNLLTANQHTPAVAQLRAFTIEDV
jgi:hypothetical protein